MGDTDGGAPGASQRLLADGAPPPVAGALLLAPVPPSGNGGMTQRYLLRRPLAALRLTRGFVARTFEESDEECRWCFLKDAGAANKDVGGAAVGGAAAEVAASAATAAGAAEPVC